jgi:hypothetical protein
MESTCSWLYVFLPACLFPCVRTCTPAEPLRNYAKALSATQPQPSATATSMTLQPIRNIMPFEIKQQTHGR